MACNCCGLPCPFRAVKVDELVCAMFFPARDSETLRREMESLRNMRMGVEEMITNLGVGWVERADVRQWIDRVNCLDVEVLRIMELVNRHSACTRLLSCVVCFSSNYSLSEKIRNKLDAVRILKGEQQDRGGTSVEAVGRRVPRSLPGTICNLPGSRAEHPVNLDDNISEIVRHLKGTGRCIGIYGMGGVGKTTLVMELVDRLKSPNFPVQFDRVISVVVSQQTDILKIQDDISVQFGFVRDSDREGTRLPSDKNDRARILSMHLSGKKFLLILDDVWEKIDLADVGIHSWSESNPMSKILLTTRNKDVCRDMQCGNHTVFVKPLNEKESWDLFCRSISNDDELWKPSADNHQIVEDVVRKCGGLPLLIVTVARAMADSTHTSQWQVAKDRLDNCSPGDTIENMEEVFQILKFSFDYLKEDKHRSCLLFCALYPEDHNIEIDTLINYWIGEGLFDSSGCSDFEGLQGRGREVIKLLTRACLLESVHTDYSVKMHDAIRDMAIWLGKGGGGYDGCKFHIEIPTGQQVMVNERWRDVHRVMLVHNKRIAKVELGVVEEEKMSPSNTIPLQTFISHGSSCEINVPESFYPLAKDLRVFHIIFHPGFSKLPLPKFLFRLKFLRHLDLSCLGLDAIPVQIGDLISLQFLNLSRNKFKQVPMELGKLTNLVVLDLGGNIEMKYIPSAAISPLRKLQILHLHGAYYFQRTKKKGILIIKDLENLVGLRNVSLELKKSDRENVRQLVEHDTIPRNSLFHLYIEKVDKLITDDVHDIAFKHSQKMKNLVVSMCPNFGGTFQIDDCCQNLVYFRLDNLPLTRFAASTQWETLRHLVVEDCPNLENLPCLTNFPNLQILHISNCDKLVGLGPMEDEVLASSLPSSQSENPSLPKLFTIRLKHLREMRSISSRSLRLPSLSDISVYKCPKLKKLPIIPPDKTVNIFCSYTWWEELVWENKSIKKKFEPYISQG